MDAKKAPNSTPSSVHKTGLFQVDSKQYLQKCLQKAVKLSRALSNKVEYDHLSAAEKTAITKIENFANQQLTEKQVLQLTSAALESAPRVFKESFGKIFLPSSPDNVDAVSRNLHQVVENPHSGGVGARWDFDPTKMVHVHHNNATTVNTAIKNIAKNCNCTEDELIAFAKEAAKTYKNNPGDDRFSHVVATIIYNRLNKGRDAALDDTLSNLKGYFTSSDPKTHSFEDAIKPHKDRPEHGIGGGPG